MSNHSPIQFRNATANDFAEMAEIYVEAKRRTSDGPYIDTPTAKSFKTHRIRDFQENFDSEKPHNILLATTTILSSKEERALGFVYYFSEGNKNELRIKDFYTRHIGDLKVGSAMLHHISLMQDNTQSIIAIPTEDSASYYKHMGFVPDTNRQGAVKLTGKALEAWKKCTPPKYPRFG